MNTQKVQQECIEGKDFYYTKEGYMVLTAEFLKKRGFCCESGCRHCPYETSKSVKIR